MRSADGRMEGTMSFSSKVNDQINLNNLFSDADPALQLRLDLHASEQNAASAPLSFMTESRMSLSPSRPKADAAFSQRSPVDVTRSPGGKESRSNEVDNDDQASSRSIGSLSRSSTNATGAPSDFYSSFYGDAGVSNFISKQELERTISEEEAALASYLQWLDDQHESTTD